MSFSAQELKHIVRSSIEPNMRRILCAINQQGAITVQPYCDDTTGDVVAYVVLAYDPATGVITTSYFDDSYAPIGALPGGSAPCADDDAVPILTHVPEYTILSGVASWTMGATTTSVSIYVDTVGDVGDRPTLQTTAGTSDLYADMTLQWGDQANLLAQPLVVTSKAGDLIFITYTTQ